MGAVAVFDYSGALTPQTGVPGWIVRYPEFLSVATSAFPTGVSEAQARGFWNEATLYHKNDGTGPVVDPVAQQTLLNMVTAHIAVIAVRISRDQETAFVVGRVSGAQGSVSASLDNQYPPGSPQWWQQTQYGSSYWAATGTYRSAIYVPGPRRIMDPPYLPR